MWHLDDAILSSLILSLVTPGRWLICNATPADSIVRSACCCRSDFVSGPRPAHDSGIVQASEYAKRVVSYSSSCFTQVLADPSEVIALDRHTRAFLAIAAAQPFRVSQLEDALHEVQQEISSVLWTVILDECKLSEHLRAFKE